jgi:hypothetical protein
VENFLDESGLEELPQLHSDLSVPFLVEVPQPLFHGFGVR